MEFQASIGNAMAKKIAEAAMDKINVTGMLIDISGVQLGLEPGTEYLFDPMVNVQATVAISMPMSSIITLVKSAKNKGDKNG